jgi:hypothetical protein
LPAKLMIVRAEPRHPAELLRCANCGVESSSSASGWRAYLGAEDDDSTCVEIFCPACAEREFGPSSRDR